jgi:peroxiredoxin
VDADSAFSSGLIVLSEFSMKSILLSIAGFFLAVGLNVASMEAQVAEGNSDRQESSGDTGGSSRPVPDDAKFKDDVKSNTVAPKSVKDLQFTNKNGQAIKLADYLGKKNVALVFTQGFNGMICPFCTTQTSRLVANYEKFVQRNCEVIVVYPGPDDHVDDFVKAALKTEKEQVDSVPFPIVLDRDFKATDYFNIHSTHAHPSTYLIDRNGGVQLAYVGADNTADRPSIKALLEKLDEIEKRLQGK